jgi:predicted DNA repair protein MutK
MASSLLALLDDITSVLDDLAVPTVVGALSRLRCPRPA